MLSAIREVNQEANAPRSVFYSSRFRKRLGCEYQTSGVAKVVRYRQTTYQCRNTVSSALLKVLFGSWLMGLKIRMLCSLSQFPSDALEYIVNEITKLSKQRNVVALCSWGMMEKEHKSSRRNIEAKVVSISLTRGQISFVPHCQEGIWAHQNKDNAAGSRVKYVRLKEEEPRQNGKAICYHLPQNANKAQIQLEFLLEWT